MRPKPKPTSLDRNPDVLSQKEKDLLTLCETAKYDFQLTERLSKDSTLKQTPGLIEALAKRASKLSGYDREYHVELIRKLLETSHHRDHENTPRLYNCLEDPSQFCDEVLVVLRDQHIKYHPKDVLKLETRCSLETHFKDHMTIEEIQHYAEIYPNSVTLIVLLVELKDSPTKNHLFLDLYKLWLRYHWIYHYKLSMDFLSNIELISKNIDWLDDDTLQEVFEINKTYKIKMNLNYSSMIRLLCQKNGCKNIPKTMKYLLGNTSEIEFTKRYTYDNIMERLLYEHRITELIFLIDNNCGLTAKYTDQNFSLLHLIAVGHEKLPDDCSELLAALLKDKTRLTLRTGEHNFTVFQLAMFHNRENVAMIIGKQLDKLVTEGELDAIFSSQNQRKVVHDILNPPVKTVIIQTVRSEFSHALLKPVINFCIDSLLFFPDKAPLLISKIAITKALEESQIEDIIKSALGISEEYKDWTALKDDLLNLNDITAKRNQTELGLSRDGVTLNQTDIAEMARLAANELVVEKLAEKLKKAESENKRLRLDIAALKNQTTDKDTAGQKPIGPSMF